MNSIIKIKNLSFAYNKAINILDEVFLEFSEGRIIVLLGKNGSGKSTLLDCILGMNNFSGEVSIDGKNLREYSYKDLAKVVSYIPQNLQVNFDYTVRDFISFGLNPNLPAFKKLSQEDYDTVFYYAKYCGISDLLGCTIDKISGGERQLAFIARALTQNTKIIVMDEPTASLDFGNQQKLLRIIKELSKKGKTILFTTHNPNHLVNLDCDIYVVKDGKVSKIDVLTPEILRDIYGEDFEWRNGVVVFN